MAAFDTTGQTYAQRKTYLDRIKSYVAQMEAINEAARKLELDMIANGAVAADVVSTVNLLLTAGGPGYQVSATDYPDSIGETLCDKIVNLLATIPTAGGVTWKQATPT